MFNLVFVRTNSVLENNSFLVDNIIPEFITVADLKYLLTCLIREQVSIKNIVYLFEKINDYNLKSQMEKDIVIKKAIQ